MTLEGSSLLHQMFRFRRREWRAMPQSRREGIVSEAVSWLQGLEEGMAEGHPNQSAAYAQLGHKGDLMLIHFRDSFEELSEVELALAQTELSDFLEPASSYVSVVELGLYESSVKAYAGLAEK